MGWQTLVTLAASLLGAGGLGAIVVAIINGRFGQASEQRKDIWEFVRNIKDELHEAQSRIDTLESRADTQRQTIIAHEGTIHAQSREIADLKAQNATQARQIEGLKRENRGLRERLARLTGLAADAEADAGGGG